MDDATGNGMLWVTRQFTKYGKPVGDEEVENSQILVAAPEKGVPQGSAYVKTGFTKNLGNFEGVRVDVGASVPCYREEVEAAIDFCGDLAEQKMAEKLREIEKLLTS